MKPKLIAAVRLPLVALLLLPPLLACLLLLNQPVAVEHVELDAAGDRLRLEPQQQQEVPQEHQASPASHELLQRRVDELLAAWATQIPESPSVADPVVEDIDPRDQSGTSPPSQSAPPPATSVRAPHLADCAANARVYAEEHWDSRPADGSDPPWAAAKGGREGDGGKGGEGAGKSGKGGGSGGGVWRNASVAGKIGEGGEAGGEGAAEGGEWLGEGPRPPWVEGSEEENFPASREVQRDIWRHQFPSNCSHPTVRFLLAPLERSARHGIGTQITLLAGALALALRSNRVLIIARVQKGRGAGKRRGGDAGLVGGFERAEHEGCAGEGAWGEWRCYFVGETSKECRSRAQALSLDPLSFSGANPVLATTRHPSLTQGTSLTAGGSDEGGEEEGEAEDGGGEVQGGAESVGQKGGSAEGEKGGKKGGTRLLFFGPVPGRWGQPWLTIPGVVEAEGRLITVNRMNNTHRWWRAQAARFFLRAPSLRLCRLLNAQRHHAYARLAATAVAEAEAAVGEAGRLAAESQGAAASVDEGALEIHLWSRLPHPWVPESLVSMHVRMGDKGGEMRVAGVGEYLHLLQRVRRHDPLARFVWLATEMQPVVEQLSAITGWTWLFTDVPRLSSNQSMPAYERSLGVQRGTDNAFVNLFMAHDAQYFIGALGSSWSYLIDSMRCTGGKMRRGFLSVNISPRW